MTASEASRYERTSNFNFNFNSPARAVVLLAGVVTIVPLLGQVSGAAAAPTQSRTSGASVAKPPVAKPPAVGLVVAAAKCGDALGWCCFGAEAER